MKQLNYRFALVMLGFAGLVWLTYRGAVLGELLAPMTTLTAKTTVTLLNWLGMEADRSLSVISHPGGFAYEIYFRCTGILPAAFLTVSILGYPGALRQKLCALAVGVPILIAINQVRLIRLFYIGVHNSAAFDTAHAIVWEALIVIAIIGLWVGWTRWSDLQA